MDAHASPRPMGRRKITPSQVAAEAAGPIPFPPTTPGRALAAFKRAEPALGVPAQVVKLIDYLVGRTQTQDWEGGPGFGPVAWPSDAELEDRLNVGATQRKATVRAALDAGYVRLRRSPNGKRWGHRDKQGRITDAYGFDLAPLAERAAEFERAAAEWEARRAEGKRLRREITCSRNHVLSLVDLAVAQELDGEDWPATAAKADALWRERGEHRDPLALVPVAARLKALAIRVQERVTSALAAVETVESEKTDPTQAGYRPHHTTTNQLLIAKASTSGSVPDEVGPNRPKAQGERGSGDPPNRRAAAQQGQAGPARADENRATGTNTTPTPSCALGNFAVTPKFILEIAPVFRDWTRSAWPGWDELARAAYDIRSLLGVSPSLWREAVNALGDDGAISALAVTCARHAAGDVRTTPGAYLGGMVRNHRAGKLHLDRTLFGMAKKVDDDPRHRPDAGRGRRHERRC